MYISKHNLFVANESSRVLFNNHAASKSVVKDDTFVCLSLFSQAEKKLAIARSYNLKLVTILTLVIDMHAVYFKPVNISDQICIFFVYTFNSET